MGGDGGGVVVRRCARREERERNRTSLFKLVRFDEVPGQDTWFVFEVPGLDTLNYYIKFISSFSNQVHLQVFEFIVIALLRYCVSALLRYCVIFVHLHLSGCSSSYSSFSFKFFEFKVHLFFCRSD
jgi:hypothetical protein